jgi:hypothetical protein
VPTSRAVIARCISSSDDDFAGLLNRRSTHYRGIEGCAEFGRRKGTITCSADERAIDGVWT